jgi:hypothetical protein
MICQNCQTDVDNDLVFCTSCGTRLNETWSQTPTVLLNESVVTKTSVPEVQKSNSNLKWMALIVALIAIPVSLLTAYLIYSNSKSTQLANANQTKPVNSPKPPANRQNANLGAPNISVNKANTINANAETNVSNSDISNSNIESNSSSNVAENLDEDWLNENAPADNRTEIWSERVGIAPENHFAVPFSVDGNDQIVGIVKTLEGPPVEGYVYTQTAFDEHFPEETYKTFSFGGEKNSKIEQTLVKEKYVLVLMNKSKKPLLIYGKIFTVNE